MPMDEVARFITDLKKDASLQAEVKAKGGSVAALIALAAARGYRVTFEDVETYVRSQQTVVHDEQLEAVTGGVFTKPITGLAGFQFSGGLP